MKKIKKDFIADLNHHFSSFVLQGKNDDLNFVWESLNYAKNNGWFNEEFYEYWLVRFILVRGGAGSFVLSNRKLIRNIYGFNEKSFGEFIRLHLDGMLMVSDFNKASLVILHAIDGGAFFQEGWLSNLKDILDIDVDVIEKNRNNMFVFLDENLDKKDGNVDSFVKI